MKIVSQIALWLALWLFWCFVSRNNHPTLVIDGVATSLLLIAFAAAVYLNRLVLVPAYWKPRRFLVYGVALLVAMNALTALDVVAISKAYDVLWGPDPARFGFWVNYGLEFTGMTVHLVGAVILVWLLERISRGRRIVA